MRRLVYLALGATTLTACGEAATANQVPDPKPLPPQTIVAPDGTKLSLEDFDQSPVSFPQATQDFADIKIGDPVDASQPPAGILPDGSFDPALVPDLIPVSRDGFVIGFVRSEDIIGPSIEGGGARAQDSAAAITIVDREGVAIGEFGPDGAPVLLEGVRR